MEDQVPCKVPTSYSAEVGVAGPAASPSEPTLVERRQVCSITRSSPGGIDETQCGVRPREKRSVPTVPPVRPE